MAVTREIALRDKNYLERNEGWNYVASFPPPVNVLLETKIDTTEDGARNIGALLERVPFGTGWCFEDGRMVAYEPTHWRLPRSISHKCQGGDWDFVRRLNAIGPGFASGEPGPVLRLSPEDSEKLRKAMMQPNRLPIFAIDLEPLAVFGTADYAPNFEVHLCTDANLFETVYGMCFNGDIQEEPAGSCRLGAVRAAVNDLRKGDEASEFGLTMVIGLQSIVAELMKRAKDIAEDRDIVDKHRADAIAALDRSEANYVSLASSILAAIAPGTAADIVAEIRNAARYPGRRP